MRFCFLVYAVCLLMSFEAQAAVSEKDLQGKYAYGDYEVRTYREQESGEGQLKIFKHSEEVFSETGVSYRVGLMYDDIPENSLVKIGNDITGDGQPDLVISHWSGGAHCCFTFYVFNIGEKFQLVDVIDNGDGDLGKFVDIDNDGVLEFQGNDWSYGYWHECFAASPAPEIILKYQDGKYRLALALMKKPLPSPEQEETLINEIRKDQSEVLKQIKEDMKTVGQTDADNFAWVKNDFVLTSKVWGHMLELIYTGHPNEAWLFLDKIYPKRSPEKDAFIKDFKKKMSESKYWDSIVQIL